MTDKTIPSSRADAASASAKSANAPATDAGNKRKKKGAGEWSLDASQVSSWLAAHPDFLLDHEELLGVLTLPDQSSGASSLYLRQLRVLRDANAELEGKLHQIVDNAKYAQSVNQRLFDLAASLLEASSLERDWVAEVRDHFDLASAALWLADTECESVFSRLHEWLGEQTARCDEQPDSAWLNAIFGVAGENVKSVAGVALPSLAECEGGTTGAILVLGAADAERFHSSMSVDALRQLGALLAPLLPSV